MNHSERDNYSGSRRMEVDNKFRITSSTFSISTVAAIATLAITFGTLIYRVSDTLSDTAAAIDKINDRYDGLEAKIIEDRTRRDADRQLARLDYEKRLEPVMKMLADYPVIVQRLTTAEANIVSNFNTLDARISRVSDAVGDLRTVTNEINTNVKLIQQLVQPQQQTLKRTELLGDSTFATISPPSELR